MRHIVSPQPSGYSKKPESPVLKACGRIGTPHAAVPLTSGISSHRRTNPSVWVSRPANGSPRTGCRGRALALGSFRMLSPKSAHGLLATPGSWVKSENAPKRRRGGMDWSKTNEAVVHVGAEGRQRPRGRGRPADGGGVPDLESDPPLYAPNVSAEEIAWRL
jgi:hypothetical protein